MSDNGKTKAQLIEELNALRQRVAECEALQATHNTTVQALHASENTLRGFIEQSSDGIFVIDDTGAVVEWNPVQAQLTGVPRDEALGRFVGELTFRPPLDDDGVRPVVQTKTFSLMLNNKHAIGSISRDVTHLTKVQEQLRERNDTLLERNEELDAFAHTVAHDLKNPLSIIIAYAAMLQDSFNKMSDDERQQDIREIAGAAQHMFRVIDELLLLAGLREATVTFEPLDMSGIVAVVRQRLQFVVETSQAEVTEQEVWPIAVGYGPWIEEVWANYITNAVKYGGSPAQIELGATECDSGKYVEFWVRDNGPGLSPEQQTRLFTPFTRLDRARAQGHGLGLSIVRRIVEKLNGQVGVRSMVGEGSTFYFRLPVEVAKRP